VEVATSIGRKQTTKTDRLFHPLGLVSWSGLVLAARGDGRDNDAAKWIAIRQIE
jgi:hypothetical protein